MNLNKFTLKSQNAVENVQASKMLDGKLSDKVVVDIKDKKVVFK